MAPSPFALVACYIAIALAPVGIAWSLDLPPRSVRSEIASGIALVGFAMLLMEFVTSGRFRLISRRTGIDATMRFHQRAALLLTTLLLVHPFLYATPFGPGFPWDWSGRHHLGLRGNALYTGIAAWLLLAVLVVTAVARDKLPYRYEVWRLSHGIGAALIAALGAHHAIDAGRYSGRMPLTAFWLTLLAVAGAALLVVYVVRPFRQLRHPYRVVSVRPVALRTWEVVIEPHRGTSISFEPGQFVWLTLDRSPFAIREHPFSISSAPSARARLEFVIKEAGDFTDGIGALAPGAPAYVDGPHGGLVLTGRSGRGLVFLAGGVGITPILSMLRELATEGDRRPMKLLYGNRVAEQIVYGAELDDLTTRLDLELIQVLSDPPAGWRGDVGQLDAALIARHCTMADRAEWLYVVCGPSAMIDSVDDALSDLGIPSRRIVSEKFSYA